MNKQDIIDEIKTIVVDQVALDPKERDIFTAFGTLIDKIEASIKNPPYDLNDPEDYAQWCRDSGDPTYGEEEA